MMLIYPKTEKENVTAAIIEHMKTNYWVTETKDGGVRDIIDGDTIQKIKWQAIRKMLGELVEEVGNVAQVTNYDNVVQVSNFDKDKVVDKLIKEYEVEKEEWEQDSLKRHKIGLNNLEKYYNQHFGN